MANQIMNDFEARRRAMRLTVEQTCERVGMSPATYYRRLKTPGDLTIAEYEKLDKALPRLPANFGGFADV